MEDFKPDLKLTALEQMDLATMCATPGFAVLEKIMRSCVDQLALTQMSIPTHDEQMILAAHRDVHVAALYNGMLATKIKNEIQSHMAVLQAQSKIPVEMHEGVDIGEYTPYGGKVEEELF